MTDPADVGRPRPILTNVGQSGLTLSAPAVRIRQYLQSGVGCLQVVSRRHRPEVRAWVWLLGCHARGGFQGCQRDTLPHRKTCKMVAGALLTQTDAEAVYGTVVGPPNPKSTGRAPAWVSMCNYDHAHTDAPTGEPYPHARYDAV